jgi:hypothetical protein
MLLLTFIQESLFRLHSSVKLHECEFMKWRSYSKILYEVNYVYHMNIVNCFHRNPQILRMNITFSKIIISHIVIYELKYS